jgi:hypothetical protein
MSFVSPSLTYLHHIREPGKTSPSKENSRPRHEQQQQLTAETRARIPPGPSNVSMYLCREETSEDIVMGQTTYRSEESMARELVGWEEGWKVLADNRDAELRK